MRSLVRSQPLLLLIGHLLNLLQNLFLDVQTVHATYKHHALSSLHQRHTEANPNSESFLDAFAYAASTDESKLRLALLVEDKIDANKDGLVQLDELVTWLRVCQDKYDDEDVNRQWISLGKSIDDNQSSIDWSEYKTKEYDNVLSLTKLSDNLEHNSGIKSAHDNQMRKYFRRWKAADSNGDGRLSRGEFKVFVHPEQNPSMRDVLLDEKIEILDRDEDGRISFDELLTDIPNENGFLNERERSEWLKNEQSKFYKILDLNHDKYLDRSELSMSMDKLNIDDHGVAEAQHLMQSADTDKDHRLSKEEVLSAYHEFVDSHVTDFGEALRSHEVTKHDEL